MSFSVDQFCAAYTRILAVPCLLLDMDLTGEQLLCVHNINKNN